MTVWDDLFNELRKKLTKKEMSVLQEMIDENGSFEDVIVTMIRKAVNPDMLSVNDIELCMQRAMKIGAYVTAVGGSKSNDNMPSQIAREVVDEAYGSSPQAQENANPLQGMMKQMAEAISTAIMSEVSNKLKSVMPLPQQNSNGNGALPLPNTQQPQAKDDKKKDNGNNGGIFTGDE